mmetsp:Transcript_19808/g.51165  ORF Transcript_19808/g.51165 Transcript_19808/m.51165 type:complete len:312 (-) Transcript_19808:804-1739(-)
MARTRSSLSTIDGRLAPRSAVGRAAAGGASSGGASSVGAPTAGLPGRTRRRARARERSAFVPPCGLPSPTMTRSVTWGGGAEGGGAAPRLAVAGAPSSAASAPSSHFSPTAAASASASASCSSACASATSAATARHSAASLRSSSRSPASRVYRRASICSSSSLSCTSSCPSPWRASCLGSRCVRAIATFSSVVYPVSSTVSILSSSGRAMLSTSFAVATKSTRERLNGVLRKWSRKAPFCSGSRTSSSADDGSPCSERVPSLSTSSSMITGSLVPHLRTACITSPGSAPTYVRRWPRISASECTPPSEMR